MAALLRFPAEGENNTRLYVCASGLFSHGTVQRSMIYKLELCVTILSAHFLSLASFAFKRPKVVSCSQITASLR